MFCQSSSCGPATGMPGERSAGSRVRTWLMTELLHHDGVPSLPPFLCLAVPVQRGRCCGHTQSEQRQRRGEAQILYCPLRRLVHMYSRGQRARMKHLTPALWVRSAGGLGLSLLVLKHRSRKTCLPTLQRFSLYPSCSFRFVFYERTEEIPRGPMVYRMYAELRA